MQKAGRIEKSTDRSFDAKERELKTYQAKVEKLQKSCKKNLDGVRGLTLSQKAIADSLELLAEGEAGLTKYHDDMSKIDEEIRAEYDTVYRTVLVEPIARFSAYFPEISQLIAKRNRKLLDLDAAKSKVKGEVEKPSKDSNRLVELEEKCAQKQQMFAKYNDQLVEGIPILFDMNQPYFEPSLEEFFKVQMLLWDEIDYCLQQLTSKYLSSEMSEYNAAVIDAVSNQALEEIGQLSIVH